jgi:hypothetical protein
LRKGDPQLTGLLELGVVAMHPFVVGEIACGSLADRSAILELLQDLPASVTLTDGAKLWTRDKRLHAAADELGFTHRDAGVH